MSCSEHNQISITCRCCMSTTSECIDIFTKFEDFNVARALQDICAINIYSQDNLPHDICVECIETLKVCHNFRMKTQETNQRLQTFFEDSIVVVEEDPADHPDKTECKVEYFDNSMSSFTCPYCSKEFVHRRNLQIHKQRHFMVGKYGCPSCTQRFHTKFDLLRHSSTAHSEQKPYACDECVKRFPTKPELNRHHRLVHNPVKTFSCVQCDMQFTLKANAKQHIQLVHTKERSHICGVCGKAFAFASKLRIHHNSSKCEPTGRISIVQ